MKEEQNQYILSFRADHWKEKGKEWAYITLVNINLISLLPEKTTVRVGFAGDKKLYSPEDFNKVLEKTPIKRGEMVLLVLLDEGKDLKMKFGIDLSHNWPKNLDESNMVSTTEHIKIPIPKK
jgi:hypothetical protein